MCNDTGVSNFFLHKIMEVLIMSRKLFTSHNFYVIIVETKEVSTICGKMLEGLKACTK